MLNRFLASCLVTGFGILFLIIAGCKDKKLVDPDFHFELVGQEESLIRFNNKLTESDSVNFLTNQYIYIGSGVGIGDFNQDGLPDIYFAGEQVSSKLYINQGDFKFHDATESARVATSRWCTGVSVVDINSDGMPDIYVSVSHARDARLRHNYLFINETKKGAAPGEVKFTEQAAAYGLDDSGFSTQAAFFDYDRDGDLDMYLMNHNVFQNQPNNIVVTNAAGTSIAADKLFRNDGNPPGADHPVFKDVSADAGIREYGYGLGIAVTDVNQDGWPDIYIANDFLSNDLLWINQHDGRFLNMIAKSMRHQSYNSMGIDAADINNDALPDIAVLDMQPATNVRKKTMFAGTNPIKYELEQKLGNYQPQFTRNMLQLHQGNRSKDSIAQPFYSEVGQLAGVSETDWSWSVLLADFDNDGWKDLQVTNGIAKDLTNNDFLFFRSKLLSSEQADQYASDEKGGFDIPKLRRQLDEYGSIMTDNYFFHNNGDLSFRDVTESVGMALPSVSHGAAYADFDNDGDLDLVVNNMNRDAFVWKNQVRKSAADTIHNFLSVTLKGTRNNPSGFGATLTLYAGEKVQFLEQSPVRGYLSTMDSRLYFGIGRSRIVDSLRVTWPDGNTQLISNIPANRFMTLDQESAAVKELKSVEKDQNWFRESADLLHIPFRHDERSFFDYATQRLLPQKFSQLGPALAAADINGDGLQDFFVGGASFQSGRLYIQTATGHFFERELVENNKTSEDLAAVFLDADGDMDQDLLITEGSSEYNNSNTLDRPRLYLNDGEGFFTYDESAIPEAVHTVAQTVSEADYDNDGDVDLFIGGRVLTNQYPAAPRSYILQNNNGKFSDVTNTVCPALKAPGMITAAVWTDLNNDRFPELLICGDWMPIRTFSNIKGKLQEATAQTGIGSLHGMWRSLIVTDLDSDGDLDLVAGNMGNNNKFHASSTRPYQLFAKDIDKNGTVDMIPAYYIPDEKGLYSLYPAIDQTEFSQEVPTIKKKYLLNADYAKVTIEDLFRNMDRKDLVELRCDTTASMWMENTGTGKFRPRALPVDAQFAPINTIIAGDITGDGISDLIIAGNEYQAEIGSGRYDASYGQLLVGSMGGKFTSMPPRDAGLILDGHVQHMQVVDSKADGPLLIVAVNGDFLRCFKVPTFSKN